jgi:polygalacturonase
MRFVALSILLAASALAAEFQMPAVKEPTFPKRSVSLADFGGVGDGKTLNTDAIAKAIASLAKQGGGRLVIPPGIWLTGPVRLQSNIHLHLEAGALLQFSSDYKLYPLVVLDVKGEKEVDSVSPISGESLENVAITGRGVIDGGGDGWRPVKKAKLTESQWKALIKTGVMDGTTWWPSREAMEGGTLVEKLREEKSLKLEAYEPARQFLRPNLLKLIGCRKVLLEGVTFQNSPNWNLNPKLCEDVTVRNVTVRNPWFSQNGDGLDLESCRNAVIRDSTFDVGDDAICLKSGKDAVGRRIGVPTENVLIENCIVYHGHGGFTIGSEMSGGVRNVRVNNCTFMGTDIGLRFKSTRGRGGVVEKIYIQNVRMTDIPGEAISFNMYYGGKAPLDSKGDLTDIERKEVPVSDQTPQFRDIHIEDVICRGARAAVLLQGLPEMPIRGIHLKNVSISSERGMTWMDADGIALKNVEILHRQGPVLTVFDVKNSAVDRLTYSPTAETVLKVAGSATAGVTFTNTVLKPESAQ